MATKTFLQTAAQDCKFGLRTMLRNPGFTVVVVLTMGLGIGASTAMFSIIRAVLLKPLLYSRIGSCC
jgi:putative ABC transport system permease protein